MAGINKAIIVGNLGGDPEVRYTNQGKAITNISVATSETWKDKQTGQPQERTEWHKIVFFNRLAEIAGEYLRKGMKVYIEGSIRTRKWQGQDGQDRYTTEIVASEMQMLDSRASAAHAQHQTAAPPPPPSSQPPTQAAATPPPAPAGGGSEPTDQSEGNDAFDDDIPF